MDLEDLQTHAQFIYSHRGYTDDLPTLGLGLAEEAGEVCGAINNLNPKYKKKEDRSTDSLEHELTDALIYIAAIANSAGIDLNEVASARIDEDMYVDYDVLKSPW